MLTLIICRYYLLSKEQNNNNIFIFRYNTMIIDIYTFFMDIRLIF